MFSDRTQSKTILHILMVTLSLCWVMTPPGPMEAQVLNNTGLPKRLGDCIITKIDWVGTRVEAPAPESLSPAYGGRFDPGSQLTFNNGARQVGYETVSAIKESRKGDPIRVCLISFPRHCPKGDNRGRVYRTTNLRTRKSWTLPDSQHRCGGA